MFPKKFLSVNYAKFLPVMGKYYGKPLLIVVVIFKEGTAVKLSEIFGHMTKPNVKFRLCILNIGKARMAFTY